MKNRPSPALDSQIFEAAVEFQAAQNGSYADLVTLHRTPSLPERSAGSAVTAFHFVLKFRHLGAATLPLTWLLAACEAYCAPVEGLQLAYAPDGEVTTTCWVGRGWSLPGGFMDFIGMLSTTPRVAAFEWTLDVLPHYSHIAARAFEMPRRFEQVGAQVRDALLSRAEWIIPEVLCPCDRRDPDNDTYVGRAKTMGILQRLRDGLLRWGER